MSRLSAGFVVWGLLTAAGPALADDPQLVLAAPTHGVDEASPRRLFNAALRAEERGNLLAATQLLLAARLSPRIGYADTLYARGAGLRLVRLLAGRDEDAALAAAFVVDDGGAASDLAPLIRSLMRRLDEPSSAPAQVWSGTITQLRWVPTIRRLFVELELDGGVRHQVEAEGVVGPFSAGHRVVVMVREVRGGRGAAGFELIAMKQEGARGWQLLRVRQVPGQPIDRETFGLGPISVRTVE